MGNRKISTVNWLYLIEIPGISFELSRKLLLLIFFFFAFQVVHAQVKNDSTFSDYEKESNLGGVRSVQNKLQTDNQIKSFRRDEDRSLSDKWLQFKKDVNSKTGIKFGISYSMVAIAASEVNSDTSSHGASGGVFEFDFYKRFIGKKSGNTGSLNMIIDWRHAYPGSIAPANLNLETGSYTSTAVEFVSYSMRPIELFWQQLLFKKRLEIAIGKIDPFNYYTQHPLLNGFTDFQNAGFSISPAAAWPVSGMGVVVGLNLLKNRNLLLKLGMHDLLGDPLEQGTWFSFGDDILQGRELKNAEIVWARSDKEELTNSFSISYWHADRVLEFDGNGDEIELLAENTGLACNVNWLFNNRHQFILAGGFSNGEGDVGLARKYLVVAHSLEMENGDALGTGINWFEPVTKERTQTTLEVYYRYRASRFTSITPTIQWIHHPSLNERVNNMLYAGFRLRFSF